MKALISATIVTLAALSAQASGYVCSADLGALKVQVYNQVQPELGTRNGAVMILSDNEVGHGNKTIAKFTSASGLLASRNFTYTANVDLRFSDSSRKGELIGGTKLGELDKIVLDVHDAFLIAEREEGNEVSAELTLVKRNGQEINLDATCTRYAKN